MCPTLLEGRVYWTALVVALCSVLGLSGQVPDRPFLDTELVFPLEHWHNHASMVVELPGGDLFVCWFHGSGERTADDVVIRGARLRKGSRTWSEPFLLADTPGYPDTNATVFLDPKKRLWLMWPTIILANEWHTALMKYKIASDYRGDGPPRWEVTDVMRVYAGRRVRGDGQPRSGPAAGVSDRPTTATIACRPTPTRSRAKRRTSCPGGSGG